MLGEVRTRRGKTRGRKGAIDKESVVRCEGQVATDVMEREQFRCLQFEDHGLVKILVYSSMYKAAQIAQAPPPPFTTSKSQHDYAPHSAWSVRGTCWVTTTRVISVDDANTKSPACKQIVNK